MPRSKAIIRPDLGAVAYEYFMQVERHGFIAQQVLPVFHTSLASAKYPVIPAEAMLETADTLRAARAAYARGDWDFDWKAYTCSENGWEEPLDDSEAALFSNYFSAEMVAVQRATLMVLRSMEKRVASKVMDTTTFANAAAAKAWNSYADADPLADINKGKAHFRAAVGLSPNALILDKDILRHVSMCDAVVDRVKYSSPNAIRGELTLDQLKAYFGVDNILVAGSMTNTAKKGKAKNVQPVWPTNKVMLACVSEGGDNLFEPCLGRTFVWDEDAPDVIVTEQYREEQTRSEVFRVRQHTDECIQFAGAGYIVTSVTA